MKYGGTRHPNPQRARTIVVDVAALENFVKERRVRRKKKSCGSNRQGRADCKHRTTPADFKHWLSAGDDALPCSYAKRESAP